MDSWNFESHGAVAYDLSVYGPNGFFRAYKGQSDSKTSANLQSIIVYDLVRGGITLQSQNLGPESVELRVQNLYDYEIVTQVVKPGGVFDQFWSLEKFSGWYSLCHLGRIRSNFLCNSLPAISKPDSPAEPIRKSALMATSS